MSASVVIQKLPSGVPGFDEVLGGGIPEFSFNLIAGGPGSGKTTRAAQDGGSWGEHKFPHLQTEREPGGSLPSTASPAAVGRCRRCTSAPGGGAAIQLHPRRFAVRTVLSTHPR